MWCCSPRACSPLATAAAVAAELPNTNGPLTLRLPSISQDSKSFDPANRRASKWVSRGSTSVLTLDPATSPNATQTAAAASTQSSVQSSTATLTQTPAKSVHWGQQGAGRSEGAEGTPQLTASTMSLGDSLGDSMELGTTNASSSSNSGGGGGGGGAPTGSQRRRRQRRQQKEADRTIRVFRYTESPPRRLR